jgi:hypothetical protein
MQVYTYSEARQKLAEVLEQAESSGKVVIRRGDGRTFALIPGKRLWFTVLLSAIFCIAGNCYSAYGETSSCQSAIEGRLSSCMEFTGSLPAPLEKICTMSRNNKWMPGKPCPKEGTLGECKVPRNDSITQIVYCYKRKGIPDKQKVGFCKQACGKGTFTAY